MEALRHSLGCTIWLKTKLSQNTIAKEIKTPTLAKSISSLPGGNHRLLAIIWHKQPGTGSSCDINQGPGNHNQHSSTGLFALFCPLELSNATSIASTTRLLETVTPVPNALYLRTTGIPTVKTYELIYKKCYENYELNFFLPKLWNELLHKSGFSGRYELK
jgi:hypothetical protein